MLKDADRTFQKYRNYYHALIVTLRPATNPKIPVTELYSRFLACGLAELESNLLAGDLELWTFRHAVLCQQVDETLRVGAREVLHARTDAAGLLSSSELKELRQQAQNIQDSCRENSDRLVSSAEEIHWLMRSGLSLHKYLSEQSAMTEPDVILVRHE